MTVFLCFAAGLTASGGPYKEAGINGYIDSNTWRHADPLAPQAVPNPIFRGWATTVVEYAPSDQTWSGLWNDPEKALGPATGDNYRRRQPRRSERRQEILQGTPCGTITLAFGNPDEP